METLTSGPRVCDYLLGELQKMYGLDRARKQGDRVCWLVEKSGWFAPRQIRVSKLFDNVFQCRGGTSNGCAPDSFLPNLWKWKGPEQSSFELSFSTYDLVNEGFIEDMLQLVESSYHDFSASPLAKRKFCSVEGSYSHRYRTLQAHELVESSTSHS